MTFITASNIQLFVSLTYTSTDDSIVKTLCSGNHSGFVHTIITGWFVYIDSVNRYTDGFIRYICAYNNLMSTGWQIIGWRCS